jgi:ferric-dicitrate binding protein FerR (iron transport regulator)
MRNPADHLDPLLARLVEETITPDELTELESFLDGNEAAQERYLHYLGLHADLTQSAAETLSFEPRATPEPRRRWQSVALAGLAASIVALLASVFFLWPDNPAAIANISEFDGSVRWIGDSGEVIDKLEIGCPLVSGTLETLAADSSAEFTFRDGTRVSVSGRSAMTISEMNGQKTLRLREGNLSIDAAPQPAGSPLLLITPSAEAEVLGTQFNVAATSFATRVTVNEGLVRVKRLADGSIQEVAADHHVVAALEQETDFQARPRKKYATTWKSELPRDILQGQWRPGDREPEGNKEDALWANPHLWKGERGLRPEPILLYTAVLNPSAKELPPVRLTDDARFVVRGRLDTSHQVHFGFGTNRLRGGFSGKFATSRNIEIDESSGGDFEIELSIHDFPRKRDFFPESPVGHEIVWMWILTVEEDAGLEITSVELVD